jgi:hypothetical protein
MKKILSILLIGITAFLFSCNQGSSDKDILNPTDTSLNAGAVVVSEETMNNLIANVSSPVEIAQMLKEEKIPFSKSYLVPTDNIDKIVTSYHSALNLGMLGTDLGYLNLYEKTGSVMSSVSSIKTLANNLKVGQFFDFDMIKRLATNSNNLDSLIFTSVSSFNDMDAYLREQNRTNVSSLIVAGVWVESTYLITQVYGKTKNKVIAERIGEQKIILNDILLILKNYKTEAHFASLIQDLEALKLIYDKVTITTTIEDSKSVVEDGVLSVVQNSSSNVAITPEIIQEISIKVNLLRKKIIETV